MVSTGLLVIADAAAQITCLGDETHLRNRRLVYAGPWKHVADLSDLTIRFLRRGVEFRAIYLAGGVLKGPNIRAQKLLCIVAGDGKDFAVAEVKAKRIDVAVKESTFSLVDQVERLGVRKPMARPLRRTLQRS